MFEDSLFVSGVSPDQRQRTRRTRGLALVSVAFQGLLLAGFLIAPLLWPETLPLVVLAPKVTSLNVRKPEVKVEPKPVRVNSSSASALSSPTAPHMVEQRGGGILTHGPAVALASDAPSLYSAGGMSTTPSLGSGPGFGVGAAPTVLAAIPAHSGPLNVSQGVSAGLLLAPIQPIYPRIAVSAGVQGTVVVTATISKEGRITGLRVLSGPQMLQQAAAEAIREARYRPYLLNGQPTDVVTTISVNFRLGNQAEQLARGGGLWRHTGRRHWLHIVDQRITRVPPALEAAAQRTHPADAQLVQLHRHLRAGLFRRAGAVENHIAVARQPCRGASVNSAGLTRTAPGSTRGSGR